MSSIGIAKMGMTSGSPGSGINGEGWRGLLTPRMAILLGVLALVTFVPGTAEFTQTALSDAFFQVTVFVAITLTVVFGLEKLFSIDLGVVMKRAGHMQSAYAALLGATPGCGGAIVVVTQFTKGNLSFGSIVSVLIATMGDAAFLLFAREPATAVLIIIISVIVGSVSGWVVDAIHGQDFLRPKMNTTGQAVRPLNQPVAYKFMDLAWMAMVVMSIPMSIAIAGQIDPNVFFGALGVHDPAVAIGVTGAVLSLAVWALKPVWTERAMHAPGQPLGRRIVDDTSFVTAWVAMAFLSFEAAVHFFGTDVGGMFGAYRPYMPLIAMLVGLIPGCGPQIIVTTLYLAGAVPLSAQLSNSIANDGDALFPAIALVPRAAILATVYSAIPALIVGYGWMLLFE